MRIVKPRYFDTFRCIASACPDSCCKEWDVQIDPEKAAFYRSLPGDLGNRLRQVLKDEDGETVMTIIDGRCPMWRTDGLCRIQAELGEEALCNTCRDFPRLTHDYGNFVEIGLELSCPEAARLILSEPADQVSLSVPGGDAPEYDTEAMKVLLRTRKQARSILADDALPIHHRLALLLMYGYHAQAELDGEEESLFDTTSALESAESFAVTATPQEMFEFFHKLQILSEEWTHRLTCPRPAKWESRHIRLAHYFIDRYWLQAVSDYDLISRVKLAVISCLAIRNLGGDLTATAQLYSKEIENSIDNVESLLDGAYTAPAFTDNRLLGMLLL